MIQDKNHKYRSFLICVFFVLAISAVYWPVYNYDFVKYDDHVYVTENTNIQSGLNLKSLCWAFTAGYASNWHPVTWLSHILDYQLFGKWAGGHHLVNVLFHILNTLLLFHVLMRMTGATWPSAFVAAAFALHPLHVESVAWVAERKDVLSTFFWLLTMLVYVRYVRNPGFKWYLVTFVFFVLGLMSKPMLVTIPFVLLLLDYWPLERKFSRRLLIEKIPFFICSIVLCVITFLVQQNSSATVNIKALGLTIRVDNAIVSCFTYITKMIWPGRLAVFYPYPSGRSPTGAIVYVFLLVLVSICFISLARRYRFLAAGWFWYLGTLVPVIGLVQVGAQAMADRYTYMTLTGLFIIIAWSAKEFVPKWHYRNIVLTVLSIAAFVPLSLTSRQQLNYWKNSLTLFEHALRVTENNYMLLSNYANYLIDLGKFDQAIERANESLKIAPNYADAHNNLGLALINSGKVSAATEQFELAVKYKPNFTLAHNNLAIALYKQDRYEDAINYFERVLKVEPDFPEGRLNLGSALLKAGRTQQAIEQFRLVVKSKPDFPQAYYNLALALTEQGEPEEAVSCYEQALEIKPDYIDARLKLALTFNELKKFDQAVESFNKALELEPNNVIAHGNLSMALAAAGKIDEAIKEIRFVLNVRPDDAEMHRNLGILLERKGQIAEAIEEYRAALRIDPNQAAAQQLLEAALKKQQTP
jgi:tetratricopeptide (TPR) repeat protein